LTIGGPVDATQVLGNLGFQIGILSGDVAHGAAVSLFMVPVLLILVILMLRFIRRREI
jgi:multiple sugar transport system permease protein